MRRYEQLAFRTAYLVLHDAADAEDAAQEAFVRAFRSLGRLRPGSLFRPWLVRIVMNEALNFRRAALRREAMAQRYGVDQHLRGPAQSPESAAVDAEQRRLLLEAIGSLRREDQAVVHLRYFLELSEAETAQVLGCPVGTVKSRLSRAVARLKQVIGDRYAGRLTSTALSTEE